VLRYWIALDPDLVQELAGLMEQTCTDFATGSFRRLADVWLKFSGGEAGESDLIISDVATKRLSIPAYFMSPELSKPFRELEDDIRAASVDKRELLKIKQKFCRAARLLDGVRNEKRYDPSKLVWDSVNETYRGDEQGKYTWTYTSPSGVSVIYVPVEYLP